MVSQESVKDNPQDIAFRNSVVDRLSTLESDYNTRKTEKIKAAKASSIAKKNLGRGAKEISGLQALQGFESGLGKPTKLNTRK
jgi:hypothetical protein